jgi:hypothetical protein
VGRSTCVRHFDLPEAAERTFLKFDGITYYATVTLNGTGLGDMLPYSEYTFEVTHLVKERDNLLTVCLEDIDRAFGPSEGWENYGGIIRDVHLLQGGAYRILDVFFKSTPEKDYRDARFSAEVTAECPVGAQARITLLDGARPVVQYTQTVGETAEARLADVRLWSPDAPNLYTLVVELLADGAVCDRTEATVGFRSLTCDKHRFYLNGAPLFLGGVCKHEMVGDSGHCPTPDQIEADLRLIKEMGCKFVRLVHYPHHKKTLEIADRIGLLVSEEPGLWWSDTACEEIAEGSKEVLRRTILRDRNHPSVAFWLCFNECLFTERYLVERAALCRAYDPTRMVSGANCMSIEDTKVYYNKCGFDFYTMHPYGETFALAQRSAEMLTDKPLLFTEWGGYPVYDNPRLLSDFMDKMRSLYLHGSDSAALAGAFIWFFAELNDFNSGEPACIDGVLHEGLVHSDRTPTLIFDAFCRGIRRMAMTEEPAVPFWYREEPAFSALDDYSPLTANQKPDAEGMLALLRAAAEKEGDRRKRRILRGPILDGLFPLSSVPYVAEPNGSVAFTGGGAASRLTLIGLTALCGGYPLGGAYGIKMGEVTIVYESGETQTVSLRNGIHVTTVFGLHASSRIDPIAKDAPRFLIFGYDKNFEIYVANRLDIPLDATRRVQSVTVTATEYPLAVYGALTDAPAPS